MKFPTVTRQFPLAYEGLQLPITPDNDAHWKGLADNELRMQRCDDCTEFRFPPAPICPRCGGPNSSWNELSGKGRIFSWVRYHRDYLPEFSDLLPYVVAVVELEEKVRMTARIVGPTENLAIDDPVELVIERWPNGRCFAVFQVARV